MQKDEMKKIEHKLYHKQRILFRAFLINVILVMIYWCLTMSGGFIECMSKIMMMPPALLYVQMMNWLALWKIAGVVLFLIPAVAIWWERCTIKKSMN